MDRSHVEMIHTLQAIWRGPMRVVEVKSDLGYTVEGLIHIKWQTMHAQRMMLYPAGKRTQEASPKVKEQAVHYDSTYHLVDSLTGVRKHKGGYEVRVECTGFENGVIWLGNLSIKLEMICRDSWMIFCILQDIELSRKGFSYCISKWLFFGQKLLRGTVTSRTHEASVSNEHKACLVNSDNAPSTICTNYRVADRLYHLLGRAAHSIYGTLPVLLMESG